MAREKLNCWEYMKCGRQPDGTRAAALDDLLPLARSYNLSRVHARSPDPFGVLVDEHGLIRQFLDILSMTADQLETGSRPPREFFELTVRFARDFVGEYHHFKEEHVLFTQLAQRKGGRLDGPIESLRHQHDRGRNHISEIHSSLERYQQGEEAETLTILENLAGYIHLLRHHIYREDHQFYPMAKKTFSESEKAGLMDLFNREDQRSGGRMFAENQKRVEEMALLLAH